MDHRLVRTDDGDVYYNYLVVALGSTTDFYAIPGLLEHALTLKSFDDGIKIRNHIAAALDKYSSTRDKSYLNFIIGGGGFTGVEFSGELTNYLRHLVRQNIGNWPPVSVWVIEGSRQLLSGLPPKVSDIVRLRLEKLGVKIRLNSRITSVDDTKVVINESEEMSARTVIWTGGVRSSPPLFIKNVACDKKDRIIVKSRLNLDLNPEVFVVGDSSCYVNPATGQPLPQTAQVAIHQGKYVAQAVARAISGRDLLPYRPKTNWPFLIPLSGKYAIMVTRKGIFYGTGAYIVRRLADFRYFISILPFRKALHFWLKGSVVYLKND